MTNLVGSAMSRATTALLDADLQLAEQVITDDEAVDALYRDIEARAFDLLARQQPVASDLRVLVTSLRMVADLERMGDNAVHVAKIARRRYPTLGRPAGAALDRAEMGHAAEEIVAKAGSVIAGRDLELAARAREGRRRDGRAAPPAVHGDPRRPLGPRASSRPSTSRWPAATTSASPTTPSRSPAASSTW